MKLFRNWNFIKYFSVSSVLSLCMATIGYFLIHKRLLNKEIISETANGITAYSSVSVHVFGSPLEIIISIGILILITLLLLYKPVKWGINKLIK